MKKTYYALFVGFVSVVLLPSVARAAFAPAADLEAERKRDKIRWDEPREAKITEEEPLPMPAPVEGEKAFFVKSIAIEGNTVIPTKELAPLAQSFENKEVTFTQLQGVATAITNYYRAKGYVTSAAYFPPQKIDEGIVTIKVMEGKIDKIVVEGNRFFRTKLIEKGLKQKPGDVFSYNQLENSLMKLNMHPDRDIRAVLIPGVQPETSDVVLKVKDKFPIHVGYSLDNLGTRLSGRLRQGFSLEDTNFLTLDDIMYAKAIVSDRHDLVGVVTNYDLPLNNGYGTRLGFNFSWIRSQLGKELKFAKVIGNASTFTPSLYQPVYESRMLDCNFTTGFNWKDSNTKVFGEHVSDDHIRSWYFGLNSIEKDNWGRTFFNNTFNLGFSSLMGASTLNDTVSRPGACGQFFRYNIDGARLQPMPLETVLILKGAVQVTQTDLLPAEQLRLGGFDTIRGYPEGEYLGDYGYNLTAEYRVPPYILPKDFYIVGTKSAWRDVFQLVTFVDVGKAYLWKPYAGQLSSMMLAGTGLGLRISFLEYINARLDWAWPVGDRPIDASPRPRFHFAMNVQY
jgi:hemolysin activation/secretion protein